MFPASRMVCSARKGLCHPPQACRLPSHRCQPGHTHCLLAGPWPPPPAASTRATTTGLWCWRVLCQHPGRRGQSRLIPRSGWRVGGWWSGTRPPGLGRAEAGGGGLGYIMGSAGWHGQPHLGTLNTAQREAASHASWRLAPGTACQCQLSSQPPSPPTYTQLALWLPWGSTQASPHARRRKGCGRQLLGGRGATEGHGGRCLGEGGRGPGPLFRLQGHPPFPSLRPPLSARPLRSPVSKISGSRRVGAPP